MDDVKEIKWIKIATSVFDNRKILQIESMPEGDGIIVIWFKLLCLAGNINDDGMIYFTQEIPYTEEMLATEFHRPLPLVRLALITFIKYGMVEIVDSVYRISNWRRYQSADKLDEIKVQNRLRKQKQRERERLPGPEPAERDVSRDSHVTERDMSRISSLSYSSSNSISNSNVEEPKEAVEKKEARKKYGQYGWVKLTDAEYERLLSELGQAELDRCIAYIDESAQSNGNKNKWKDWNLVVRKCSRQGWGRNTGGRASGINPRPDGQGNGGRVFDGETIL